MTGLPELIEFLRTRRSLLVLTGAGCSTGSGIPDYRDENGAWKRSPPVDFRDFMKSDAVRRRYWARSFVGFLRMSDVRPNPAHRALAELEAADRVRMLVTQNVDGLHQRAGSRSVIDLHGRIDTVVCMSCGMKSSRRALQARLRAQNPLWGQHTGRTAPDGDADLGDVDYGAFEIVACAECAGMLKPDVVFFGETVPAERVASVRSALEAADGLLVVGSSLMVYSGYRFVRQATELGLPIAVVNRGRTRADAVSAVKVDGDAERVLPEVTAAFQQERGPSAA